MRAVARMMASTVAVERACEACFLGWMAILRMRVRIRTLRADNASYYSHYDCKECPRATRTRTQNMQAAFVKSFVRSRRSDVPRVPGSLIFGNLFEFQRDRVGLQHRVARELGDMAELRIGFIPLLMASSPALAHELLVEKNDAFIKSAGLSVFAKPLLGDGLLTIEHDEHKKQRKMMAPLFAHKR